MSVVIRTGREKPITAQERDRSELSGGGYATLADMLSDTRDYGWNEGDIVSAGGVRYRVAAPKATDHHVQRTNGSAKFYLLPSTLAGLSVAALSRYDRLLADGAQIICTGYYDDTPGTGGGRFYYDANCDETPNGGTVIEARVGRYVRARGEVITPHSFGVREGADLYENEGWTAFIADMASDRFYDYTYEIVGDYTASGPVVIDRIRRKAFAVNLRIAAIGSLETILRIQGCNRSNFNGVIQAVGRGGANPSSNNSVRGVHITNCARATFEKIFVEAVKEWGVFFDDSNMARLNFMEGLNCGRYPGGRDLTISAGATWTNSGSSGQTGQYTEIVCTSNAGFSEVLSEVSFLRVNRVPYRITLLDEATNTIRVFPQVPEGDHAAGDYDVVTGGAYAAKTNANAKNVIGHILATRTGIGAWLQGPSAPFIESYVGQYQGVALVLGGPSPTNAYSGAHIANAYFEATRVAQIVNLNGTESYLNGTFIAGMSSTDPARFFNVTQRSSQPHFPVAMMQGGKLWNPDSLHYLATASSSSSYTLTNRDEHFRSVRFNSSRSDVQIRLRDDEDYRRLKGNVPIHFLISGANANGGFSAPGLTIQGTNGYTVNGAASIPINTQTGALLVTALLDRTESNWDVFITPAGGRVREW
jgi:hypothetical protein